MKTMTMTEQEMNRRHAEYMRDDLRRAYNADGLYDYIVEQELDVEYTLDSSKELIGVCLYIELGGPTTWIDTRRNELVVHHGDSANTGYALLDEGICDAITDIYREIMEF